MNEQEKRARFLMQLAMDLRLKMWPKIMVGKGSQLINGRYR